jgi:RND family efflux transporter MFP subunit
MAQSRNHSIIPLLVTRRSSLFFLLQALVSLCLSACSESTRPNPEVARAQAGQAKVNVVVAPAQRKDLVRKITLPGTLVGFHETTLYGKVTGYLASISVDKGDTVRRGQTLAVLEIPEMAKEIDQAEAAYQEAVASLNRFKAQAELQSSTYQRYMEVHSKDPDAISTQELDEYRSKAEVARTEVKLAEAKVATARANRDRLITLNAYSRITAPFGGVVTARFVDPGGMIQTATSANQPILTIQDLCTVRVYVSVPERDVPFIHNGSEASLTTAAYPGKVFKAAVTRFAEALDPATRTMKTEMDIRNPGHSLRPGMYADVTLELEKRAGALLVPDPALVIEGQHKFVWIVRDGAAHRVSVETGLDDGTQAEIISGLAKGDLIVLTGKETLTDGKAVEPSPQGNWMR